MIQLEYSLISSHRLGAGGGDFLGAWKLSQQLDKAELLTWSKRRSFLFKTLAASGGGAAGLYPIISSQSVVVSIQHATRPEEG